MSNTADLIADMVREGVSPEIIGRVAAALAEREVVVVNDEAADRRRERDRERKRNVRRNPQTSADDADSFLPSEVSPHTPLPNNPQSMPPSPPKGGSSPTPIRLAKPSAAELDAIWTITPRHGRERSSRRDLERALTAAMRRGHDPSRVLDGLRRAYASDSYAGERAKGVHRLIENDRWASFLPEDDPQTVVTPEKWRAALAMHAEDGWWSDGLGPPPGKPGCRVPPELIANHPAQPKDQAA